MARFKLNLHQMLEETATLKEDYQALQNDQDSLYKVTATVDNSWNDENTPVFLSCVANDQKEVEKVDSTFLDTCDEIEKFLSSFEILLRTNDVNAKRISITYDDDFCTNSIQILNDAIELLGQAQATIDNADTSCNASNSIHSVKNNILKSKNELSYIKGKMKSIQSGTSTLLENTKVAMKSYPSITIQNNQLQYNWQTVSFVQNNVDRYKSVLKGRALTLSKDLEYKEVHMNKQELETLYNTNKVDLKYEKQADLKVEKETRMDTQENEFYQNGLNYQVGVTQQEGSSISQNPFPKMSDKSSFSSEVYKEEEVEEKNNPWIFEDGTSISKSTIQRVEKKENSMEVSPSFETNLISKEDYATKDSHLETHSATMNVNKPDTYEVSDSSLS